MNSEIEEKLNELKKLGNVTVKIYAKDRFKVYETETFDWDEGGYIFDESVYFLILDGSKNIFAKESQILINISSKTIHLDFIKE